MSLSACLIVRNEERFLDRCLRSLRGVADQICVVDTGSTDGTARIALAHGATFSTFPWDDDFAAARNACLDLAKGDWILQVDADEELAPVDARALARILSEPDPCRLVELELLGDGGRSERTWQPRLFRRDSGLRYRRALHETVLDDLAERRLPPPRPCPLLLIHHGYVGEVVASRDKIERNRRILRKVRDRGEADAYDLFKLASALDAGDDPSLEAERTATWRACLAAGWTESVALRSEWPWWPRSCRAAAAHLWTRGHLGESLAALRRLLGEHPEDSRVRSALALTECRAGRARDGVRLAAEGDDIRCKVLCLEASGDFQTAWAALVGPGAKVDALRARILALAGRSGDAIQLLEPSFTTFLEDPESGCDAAVAFHRLGENALACNILARPLQADIELAAERSALARRLSSPERGVPPRDVGEAAEAILAEIRIGRNPSPLDPGFHPPAVREALADRLESLLRRHEDAAVRLFAARSPAWEAFVPGISKLVESF